MKRSTSPKMNTRKKIKQQQQQQQQQQEEEQYKALPFIICENNQYSLNPEAVTFLQNLGSIPLAIVSIAGKYRTGKSHLINKVLLNLQPNETGFQVGPSINPCTKGLWIHTKVTRIESTHGDGDFLMLVIDTEGIGALNVDATSSHDSRIFSLALLLSSYFIYNSVGVVDERALSELGLVANITQHIKVSTTDTSAPQELAQFFPQFCWVVRDFGLQLIDENKRPIEQAEYLERALAESTVPGENATEKNSVRTLLKTFFPKRDCVTLVRPVTEETMLQELDTLPETEVRGLFLDQIKTLRKKILLSLRPYRACGTAVTGSIFVQLAQSYIEAINSGVAPVIKDSWSLVSETECRSALEEGIYVWDSDFSSDSLLLPLSAVEIERRIVQTMEKIKQVFLHKAIGDKVDTYRDKLNKQLRIKAEQLRQQNVQALNSLAEELVQTHIEMRLNEFTAIHEVMETHNETQRKFLQQYGTDMMTKAAWSSAVVSHVWTWVKLFTMMLNEKQLQLQHDNELLALKSEKADALYQEVKQLNQTRQVLEEQQRQCQEQLETYKLKNETLLQELSLMSKTQQEIEAKAMVLQETVEKAQFDLELSQSRWAIVEEDRQREDEQKQQMQQEIQTLKQQILGLHSLQMQVESLQQEKEMLEDTNKFLREEMEKEQDEFNETMEKFRTESKELIQSLKDQKQQARQEYQQQLGEVEQRYKSMEEKHLANTAVLQQKIATLQAQMESMTRQLESTENNFEQERSSMREALSQSRTDFLQMAQTHHKQLEAKTEEIKTMMLTHAQQNKLENERHSRELMEARRQSQTFESKFMHTSTLLQESQQALKSMHEQNKQQDYVTKISNLEMQCNEWRAKATMWEQTTKEKTEALNKLNKAHAELQAQSMTLEKNHRAKLSQLELNYEKQLSVVKSKSQL